MADIISTSISGLRAFQTALATTSHNISNVGTEGYSRQIVELTARQPLGVGNFQIGQGVDVQNIERIVDDFVTGNIRDFKSEVSRLDIFNDFASRVENLIADDQGSLMPALDNFFNSVNDLANDPSSNAPRVAMLSAAEVLEQRVVSLATEMQQLEQEVDERLSFEVNELNAIATELGRINESISKLSTSVSQPSDLLDKRDVLLQRLAEKISVTVVEQNDGILNVLVGTGQLLVAGNMALQFNLSADPIQPDRLAIALQSPGGNIDVSNTVSGGSIGGLLDFRDGLLDSSQNRLGRVAIAVADTFNAQHQQGYDLNGNLGGAFFNSGSPQTLPRTTNLGLSTVTATVSDVTALTVSDYSIDYDGANYNIVRLSDNVTVASALPAAFPLTNIDGMDFSLGGGAPVAGDSFYLRPTRLGAIGFSSQISQTNLIAAASPIRTSIAATNIGDVSISSGTIVDVTNANLSNTVTITFNTPANTFDIFDVTAGAPIAAGVAFTDGMTVPILPATDINGWSVRLNGIPQPGDVLTIEENIGAASDNRNALALAGLRTQSILDNNTASYQLAYSALVSEAGAVSQQVHINLEVEQSLLLNATAERESISGVNLDEEAANLIKFQQAYQAMSRVVQTANTLFDSLLQAV